MMTALGNEEFPVRMTQRLVGISDDTFAKRKRCWHTDSGRRRSGGDS